MKLSIYLDVAPWMHKPEHFYPVMCPATIKAKDGEIRYRIDFEIPDPAQPDVVIQGQAVKVEEA